jgi:hypothetical protein
MSAAAKCSKTLLKLDGLVLEIVRGVGGQVTAVHLTLPSPGGYGPPRGGDVNAANNPGPAASSVDRFWVELVEPKGELHKLRRTCASRQMHQAYLLWAARQGIDPPVRNEEFGAILARKSGVCMRRGWVRLKDSAARQTRCLYFDDELEPPAWHTGTKIAWLSSCVEAFGAELSRLQKAGVLALPGGGERAKTPRSNVSGRRKVTRVTPG